MASKVLLADWSTGAFGLIMAGEVMDSAEARYTALASSGAPFADYVDGMAPFVAAFRNQAKILPQGQSHVDLTGVLEAAGLLVPPGQGNVVGTGPVVANSIPRNTDTTGKATGASAATVTAAGSINVPAGQTLAVNNVVRDAIPTMVATQTGTPVAALIDQVIPVDATAGAAVVNLPAVAAANIGKKIIVRKTAGANTVTIDGNGAEQIDGAATKVIAADAAGRDMTAHLLQTATGWISI